MTIRTSTHRLLTIALSVTMVLAMIVAVAFAHEAVDGHELEGDILSGTSGPGTEDWAEGTTETGIFDATDAGTCFLTHGDGDTDDADGFTQFGDNQTRAVVDGSATLICDSVDFAGTSDANIYDGGAKEGNPDSQTYHSGPVTPKTDLTHAYARGVFAEDSNTAGGPHEGGEGDADDADDAWVIAAYEVIPKQGSYHTNVEFNQRVKCVGTTTTIVDDVSSCQEGDQVVPFRTAGDVLLAVDIGGNTDGETIRLLAFIATGGNADPSNGPLTHATYNFGNNSKTTVANADYAAFGDQAIDNGIVKVFLNDAEIDCGPWRCFDDGYNHVDTLPAEAFVEVGVNLSFFTPNVCLNNVAFKSRASGQSITSQLKDTTTPQPFAFCGGLTVRKFIDAAEDGLDSEISEDPSTDDVTSDTGETGEENVGDSDLYGWSFTVYGPFSSEPDLTDPDTYAASNELCSDTTDDDGVMGDCDGELGSLAPGWYAIVEDDPANGLPTTDPTVPTVNTYPGPTALDDGDEATEDDGSVVAQTVQIGQGSDKTVYFGNTCTIEKTFKITGVTSGTDGLLVWYDNNTSDDGPSTGENDGLTYVTMTQDSSEATTYRGTADDRYREGDSIEWGFGIDHNGDGDLEDAADDVVTVGDETFDAWNETDDVAADGYDNCTRENVTQFAPPTLTVIKHKDMKADGLTLDSGDPADDDLQLLGGWTFKVWRDGGDGVFDAGEPYDPGDGEVDGDDILVGSYTTATEADVEADEELTVGHAEVGELAPGQYWVEELGMTNWTATHPAPDTDGNVYQGVFLNLTGDGDDEVVRFANTPEASFDVIFNDLTGSTDATITCAKTKNGTEDDVDPNEDVADTHDDDPEQAAEPGDEGYDTNDTFESENVLVGTYECTIVITDP